VVDVKLKLNGGCPHFLVQEPFTAGELEVTRYSVSKGKPFGKASWSDMMIDRYKLVGTVRERGRPKKGT